MSERERAYDADRYPYELAIVNLIFVLLAIGAVFDGNPTELRFRVIMPAVLTAAGVLLFRRTKEAGYLPTRVTTNRLRPDQRNVPGWTTVFITLALVVLVPATLLS